MEIEEIEEAIENNEGYCPPCEEFTGDFAEGDAVGYKCSKCGNHTVIGAENALLMGYFA